MSRVAPTELWAQCDRNGTIDDRRRHACATDPSDRLVSSDGSVLCDSMALGKKDPVVGAMNGDATALGVLSEGLVLSEADLQAYSATGDGIVFGE